MTASHVILWTFYGQRRGKVILEVQNMRMSWADRAMAPIIIFPLASVLVHRVHAEEVATIWTVEVESVLSCKLSFIPPQRSSFFKDSRVPSQRLNVVEPVDRLVVAIDTE